jgi:hypothetical protein
VQTQQHKIKRVQKAVGSILYYARAVDMMMLIALSTNANKQMKGTERMMEMALQVLDYLATHLNAIMHLWASNMIKNTLSNVLYLTEPKSCRRACGHFF